MRLFVGRKGHRVAIRLFIIGLKPQVAVVTVCAMVVYGHMQRPGRSHILHLSERESLSFRAEHATQRTWLTFSMGRRW